ncbi:MAG: bifunctional oligoribonuclease/PAP phosphatase NrnA [Butyricicoccaceae bacterium]
MIVTTQQAAQLLMDADRVLILTHLRPDGDTCGSASALCLALREAGKTAYLADNTEITPRYRPLTDPLVAPEGFAPSFIVSVDISTPGRIAPSVAAWAEQIDLVIDHHEQNPNFGRCNLVRSDYAACAEIIYEVIRAMGIPLTCGIAEAIYTGTSSDTGSFRYKNTTSHTLRVAADCLDAGADGGEINRRLFEVKSRARHALEGYVFARMSYLQGGAIGVAVIPYAVQQECGAGRDELETIAALPRQIEGVEVGLTIIEQQDGSIRASVRTGGEYSAAEICRSLGGGGHLRAAGVTMHDVSLEEACGRIQTATEKYYCGKA